MTAIIRKAIVKTGAIVTVVTVTGGWTTVRDSDAKELKFRNSALRDLTDMEISMTGGKAEKPAKPAKEPKAAKPPKAAKVKPGVVNAEPETDVVLSGDGSEVVSKADKLVRPDYDRYTKHDTKSPSGRKALDINDEAAKLLRGQDIEDCYFVVAKNLAKTEGADPDSERATEIEAELKEKYKNLNIGMQRMNLGNRLRKALGTYGNLNAHKGQRSTDNPTQAELDEDAANGHVKYGKRTGEKLKRASDPAAAAA